MSDDGCFVLDDVIWFARCFGLLSGDLVLLGVWDLCCCL